MKKNVMSRWHKFLGVFLALVMLSSQVNGFTAVASEVEQAREETAVSQTNSEVEQAEEVGDLSVSEPEESEPEMGLFSIIQPPVVTHTYVFKVDEDIVSTQILKDKEKLIEPESPVKDGYKFTGWFIGEDKLNFSESVKVSETSEINVDAKFEEIHYVFFMDGTDENARVFKTKEGINGDEVSLSDVKLPISSTQAVTGWYTNRHLSGDPVDDPFTITTGNQQLWPKIESGNYIYFDSGEGASYIEPQFVKPMDTTVAPKEPIRAGFGFNHWSEEPNGEAYDFGKSLSADITLYAVWTPEEDTNYTVVIWKQSVKDAKGARDNEKIYDYAESEKRTAKTGEKVEASESDKSKAYSGFHLNTSKTQAVEVKGDGTTVLNVYYDRNLLTIKFYSNREFRDRDLLSTFEGLYGQTLAQNRYTWPSDSNWYQSNGSNLTFLDAFIFDDLSTTSEKTLLRLYKSGDVNGNISINHYKQNLDGTYKDSPDNSTSSRGGTFTLTNKYNGFTVKKYKLGNANWQDGEATKTVTFNNHLHIRYERNTYDLVFYNYNSNDKTEKVKFEDTLKTKSYEPERPSGLPEEYVFQGWYKDTAYLEAFDFNSETMPAAGLTIYAKWAAPEVEARIHLTMSDDDDELLKAEIAYNEPINPVILPTVKDSADNILSQGSETIIRVPEGYKWIGWATKAEGGDFVTWNFETKVLADIDLYPYYVNNKGFTVTYKNGEKAVKTDPKPYAEGSYADVMTAVGLNQEGKVFIGWKKDGSEDIYQPGDKIKVDDDLVLMAQWGPIPQGTSITYFPNGALDAENKTIDSLTVNASYEVGAKPETWMKENHYFIGWNTKNDGSGDSYQPGEKVLLDNEGENALYAQWEEQSLIKIEISGEKQFKTYTGEVQNNNAYSKAITVNDEEVTELPDELELKEPANIVATGKDVGTYKAGLSKEAFSVTGDKLYKYIVEIEVKEDIELKIEPKLVTLTSATDSKVYDGTALKKDEVTVSGDGFADGEGASYAVTGTQTEVGTSDNRFTYTLNEGTKAENYAITQVEGTLTVTALTDKVTVTITENSDTTTYDGKEHTIEGYTVEISNPLYKEDDFSLDGVATAKGTNAGTYNMELKPEDFTNTNANFANVEFVIVDGTLEISKREVTLTSATDSKVYDGTALKKDAVTVSGDGFVEGEGASYTVTGTQTDVGTSDNSFTYTLNDGTLAENYAITKVEGTLTVTALTDKVTVTITEKSGTEKYDGTEKTVEGYTVAISNELYTEKDFTFSGDATVKGTNAGTYNMELKPENFSNDNKNFANVEFVIVDGTLEISKREVTLTSATDSKVYDGTALKKDAVTVSGDGFADGEGASYAVTGTQTDVGTSDNSFTYTLNDGTLAENYAITKVEGTLTVTALTDKVTVTITEKSGTEKYDGTEKTVEGYTVAISNELYKEEDFTFSGDATVKGTNAGTYNMELKPEDFTNTNANFANVEFVIVDGTLEITKREVTLTSATDSKVYDGTALKKDEVTVSGDGFVEGEGASYTVTGTQTDVGNSKNTFTYTLNDGTLAENYAITKVEGTLTVTALTDKVTVTITENSGTEKYDGTEKTVEGYTVAISNELYTEKDFTFSGDATVKGTNAGTYNMELKPENFSNDNKNFANVEFVIVDGTLEITKREVTLASATDSKVYDGTALKKDEVTVSGDGFVEGEGASYTVTGTQTDVGTSDNSFTYTLNDGTLAENYAITKVEGTLTVTALTDKVTVTITENSGTEKYDGTEKTVEGYTVAISNELYTEKDFTFSGDATVKGTNAGTYNMELKPENFSNDNKNFANVEFVIVDGTLEITKREVTLTSATDSKVYDGTALKKDAVTVSGDGFADGEGASYDVTGTQTDVGTSDNRFTYTLNDGTLAENYAITKVEGTLTVTALTDKVTVTITENSGTEKYDGTDKTVKGYTVAISNELYTEKDFTFSGDATVKGTNAGTYNMELKPENFTNTNKNFSEVEFVIVDGTLEITKREVTLTSATDSKVYDGMALTNAEVTVSGDGFADGEGASYTVTGTQTDVGTSDNRFTYTLNDGTLAENYAITQVEGTLTVTAVTDKVTVTITENSDTTTYDGKEHTIEGYTVEISNPLYKEDDFSLDGVATAKGTDAGTYNMELKPENFSNTNANFANVEFVIKDGTLEIAKAPLTVKTDSANKVYDGEPLTAGGTIEGLVNGEKVEFRTTGSQTEVGSSPNTYEIIWPGEAQPKTFRLFGFTLFSTTVAKESNYFIEEDLGNLTVTEYAEEITVTTTGGTFTYDAKPHGATVEVSKLPKGYTLVEAKSDATATDVTEEDVVAKADTLVIENAQGEDVTAKLNIKYVDGAIKIEPRPLTVTTPDANKLYDGTALTAEGKLEGLVEGEEVSFRTTGSQTAVGSSKNSYSLVWDKTAKEKNYTVTEQLGTLTVTEYAGEIVVTTTGGTFTYDGKAHGATVEVSKLPEGYTLAEAKSDATATDVTKEDVVAKADTLVIENAQGEDVTAKLNIKYVDGTIKIVPRKLTVATPDANKIYDGKALTAAGKVEGLVEFEEVSFKTTGSQTEVGSSKNSYSLVWDKNAKEQNYEIVEQIGTLTVEAKNEVPATGDMGHLYRAYELAILVFMGILLGLKRRVSKR